MLGIEGSFLHHFRKKVEAFIAPTAKNSRALHARLQIRPHKVMPH